MYSKSVNEVALAKSESSYMKFEQLQLYVTLVSCHLLHKLVERRAYSEEASFVSDLNVFIPLLCLRLKHVYFKNLPKLFLSLGWLIDPLPLWKGEKG